MTENKITNKLENTAQALEFLSDLERGNTSVIEKVVADNGVSKFILHIENKQKIVQLFSLMAIEKLHTEFGAIYRDKIPLLEDIERFRVVPGAIIRRGVCIEDDAVIMPSSFINLGAHVGTKTMIDSGVTVGSCVYVGRNCHISSNTVLAGVLEPVSAMPVVIDDNAFIGAQCLVAEGARIGRGAILAAGVHITSSTKIIDRVTGEQYNHVPDYAVVVPGSYESISETGIKSYINCAYIIKKVDEQVRGKTSINELLRA